MCFPFLLIHVENKIVVLKNDKKGKDERSKEKNMILINDWMLFF